MVSADPLARDVRVTGNLLDAVIADGQQISVPLVWFPRLSGASAEQRNHWELIGGGIGIHWPGIDEDIAVESLLRQL